MITQSRKTSVTACTLSIDVYHCCRYQLEVHKIDREEAVSILWVGIDGRFFIADEAHRLGRLNYYKVLPVDRTGEKEKGELLINATRAFTKTFLMILVI